MLKSLTLIAALVAGPAFATGLDITVSGEANGVVHIDLFDDVAPGHVEQITKLASEGAYDNVVFHRVIDGFMAQTGDVQYGKMGAADFSMQMAGRGGSTYPDLKAEFSDQSFDTGVVGMARSQNPNSANAQFFIMFAPAPHLDGQYTVVGKVTSGMDVVNQIKRGTGPNGAVIGEPDVMTSVKVTD
ncbi:peptidylprolyl isomerase [Celeribacter naphthalenivorans]|uniref:peptidylprolyl isomerase n=1 Tax=Celeribacter naphthalenivorans TaxID=1614694 RepID=UPI001CFC0DE4|nr:peptidylprolyl isomerase [Celeribacter naphthalenivorans]